MMSWPLSHTRRAELRAVRFADAGGTRSEYLATARAVIDAEARAKGWNQDDILREMRVHAEVARKVWDAPYAEGLQPTGRP